MKNKEFDEFIRANTQEELSPPSELDWGNMDIPLPPKKRKRNPLLMILPLILILALLSAIWIYLDTKNTTKEIVDTTSTTSTPLIEENNDCISSPEKETIIQDVKDERMSPAIVLDKASPTLIKATLIPTNKQQDFVPNTKKATDSFFNNDNSLQHINTSTPQHIKKISTKDIPIPSRQKITESRINNISPLLQKSNADLQDINTLISSKQDLIKEKPKRISLLLSVGYNISSNNFSTDILRKSETSAWGQTYQLSSDSIRPSHK